MRKDLHFCVDIDNVLGDTDEVMRRVITEYTDGRVQLSYQHVKEFNYADCVDDNGCRISKEEWNAIQAGAISDSKLREILNKADLDTVRKLATPQKQRLMTDTRIQRAKQMLASGYTQAEVADALGVSLTTLKTSIAEG